MPAVTLIALICWAIAAPIGSSPDDDFHLPSIWCGLGERPGVCESVPGKPAERAVPALVAHASDCYKWKSYQSAACIASTVAHPNSLVPTNRGNFDKSYPPLYYATMSLLVTSNVTLSVILMRIVNILIFLLIASVLFALLRPSRRWTLVWMWSVTVVPLGMFLIASNNPSAWAIISGGSLWIALVGYFESHGRSKLLLGVVAVVTALMGAGARADAAVYVGIAVVVSVILTYQRTRRYLLSCILPLVLACAALILYRLAGQAAAVSSGLDSNHVVQPVAVAGSLDIIWNNLLDVPSLWAGSLGTWALGWLDTPMPGTVWAGCMLAFSAVIFAGIVSLSARKIVTVVVVLGALIAIPSWVLLQSKAIVGQEVQPRYLFPLLIMFAGLMLLQVGTRRIRFTRVQMWVVAAVVAIANCAALFTNLRRYVTGLATGGIDLDHGVQWWWNTPILPMAVWIIGSITFAAAIVIALREVTVASAGLIGDSRSASLRGSEVRTD